MNRPAAMRFDANAGICHNATQALCQYCGKLTDAKIVFHRDRVYLVKWCAEHGESRALICSDKNWYLASQSYVKPRTEPAHRAVSSFSECPKSCGLCPEHQQHTCVPILEITDRCDMHCPICLVSGKSQGELSIDQLKAVLDNLVRCEGRINMLTLSGGEPTIHPRFLEIVDEARGRKEIGVISVSTNGLNLASNESLLRRLIEREVVISLQCDGFAPEACETLRGMPGLAELKRKLIDRILALGGKLSLTMTMARGINEPHVADLLELLFSQDQVLSIMIQPLSHHNLAQSKVPYDPLDIVTIPEVVSLVAEHSSGRLRPEDFTPLPCSHPSCFALTYLLKTQGGDFVSLPSLVDTAVYLDVIKNQALLNTDADTLAAIKNAIYSLWSAQNTIPANEDVLKTVKAILLKMNKLKSSATLRETLDVGVDHVKSIFIHHFMDRATFDLSRAIKCCNHYPTADGKLLPACVRNNL